MSAPLRHDPLSALSEAEATGETAALFADIRATMRLPLLTSIWRTLAGVEGGLSSTWEVAKPLFESGYPDILLAGLRTPTLLPLPPHAAAKQVQVAGLSREALTVIRQIIDSYTRSNSLNLLVLSALFAEPVGQLPEKKTSPDWVSIPKLPRLLGQQEIDPATWELLLDINRFGASPDEPGLATLWRHLAYWPEVLSVLNDVLLPMQEQGVIAHSIAQVLDVARVEGGRLAALRPSPVQLPETAHAMIEKYVTHPGLVARMVAIGNGLSLWLQSESGTAHG